MQFPASILLVLTAALVGPSLQVPTSCGAPGSPTKWTVKASRFKDGGTTCKSFLALLGESCAVTQTDFTCGDQGGNSAVFSSATCSVPKIQAAWTSITTAAPDGPTDMGWSFNFAWSCAVPRGVAQEGGARQGE